MGEEAIQLDEYTNTLKDIRLALRMYRIPQVILAEALAYDRQRLGRRLRGEVPFTKLELDAIYQFLTACLNYVERVGMSLEQENHIQRVAREAMESGRLPDIRAMETSHIQALLDNPTATPAGYGVAYQATKTKWRAIRRDASAKRREEREAAKAALQQEKHEQKLQEEQRAAREQERARRQKEQDQYIRRLIWEGKTNGTTSHRGSR